MGDRAPLFGKYGERCIVAHRANGFLAVLDHGVEDRVEIFQRETGGDLTAVQLFTVIGAWFRSRHDQRFQLDHVFQPARIVVLGRQGVDNFIFAVKFAALEIDRDHATGRDVDAARNAFFGHAGHAGFRTDDQQSVLGFGDAQRTQAVAVLAGDDPAAVGGADGGRAVPWLHDGVAIGVKRLVGFGNIIVLADRFGDQQGLGHRRRTAGANQQFKDVVECGGIGAARLDHRLHIMGLAAEGGGSHADLVRLHPVDVAAQGVDFTVVSQHAERLGQTPFGEGVGRETLVENSDR